MRRFCALCCIAVTLIAEETIQLTSIPLRSRFTYEDWLLNGHEHMGVVGAHEDAFISEALPGAYIGLGFYGGAAGSRGGFFALGTTLGWTSPRWSGFGLDTGAFVGGGGEAADAGQGGGLVWRAHAMASYALPGGALQAGYAYTDFPDGDIRGNGLAVGLVIDDSITLAGLTPAAQTGGIFARRRWGVAPLFERYWLDGDLVGRKGKNPGDTLDVLGLEFINGLGGGWSIPIMMGGALSGSQAGYMEVLGGVAYGIGTRWHAEARVLTGLGGGGIIDSGGGVLVRPEIGVGLRLGHETMVEARGGRLYAIEGDFSGWMTTLALRWDPEWWHVQSEHSRTTATLPAETVCLDSWRIAIGTTTYHFRGDDHVDINLFDVSVEKPFASWFAAVGRTRWAYLGEAGGYAEGLFGLRCEAPIAPTFRLALEGDLGAGGGAALSTGDGVIAGLGGDLRWQFWNPLELRVGYSRVVGLDGGLSVDSVTVGVVCGFTRALIRE